MAAKNVDSKVDLDTVDTLIRRGLMGKDKYDEFLANTLGDGGNVEAVDNAIAFLERYPLGGNCELDVKQGDFTATIDALCVAGKVYPEHSKLIPLLRALGREVGMENELEPTETDEPEFKLSAAVIAGIAEFKKYIEATDGLLDKAKFLCDLWFSMFLSAPEPQDLKEAYISFVEKLKAADLLNSDENILVFFKVEVEYCVGRAYQLLADESYPREESCYAPDAFVQFVILLIRDVEHPERKTNIMEKFLGVVTSILKENMEVKGGWFQSLPFERCLISLLIAMAEPENEINSNQAWMTFSSALHTIRPTEASGFAFAWLEILGHRAFIGRMLAEDTRRWWMVSQLFLDLFNFIAPFVKTRNVTRGVLKLYRGTHRLLLLILHDFPDFLVEFGCRFMDVLPPTAVPLRNVIQSAIPRLFQPPYQHPYKRNMFEQLGWVPLTPMLGFEPEPLIRPEEFKEDLDFYLDTATPLNFLHELKYNFQFYEVDHLGNHYNIPLLNAVLLYVGSSGVEAIFSTRGRLTYDCIRETTHFDIFYQLAHDLDNEGLYLFSTSLVNHLRFASSHTFYFGVVILELFRAARLPAIKEIIVRVFVERLMAHRPWPWGILLIVRELSENPFFNFWEQPFVVAIPQIKQLIEHVKEESLAGCKNKYGESKMNEGVADQTCLSWPDDDTIKDEGENTSWPDDETITEAGQISSESESDTLVGSRQSSRSSDDDTVIEDGDWSDIGTIMGIRKWNGSPLADTMEDDEEIMLDPYGDPVIENGAWMSSTFDEEGNPKWWGESDDDEDETALYQDWGSESVDEQDVIMEGPGPSSIRDATISHPWA